MKRNYIRNEKKGNMNVKKTRNLKLQGRFDSWKKKSKRTL